LTAYDEKDLILQVSQGNGSAFAELFNRYRDPIYKTAWRLTDSTSTAEDVLQEVFLVIWLNRATLPGISNFKAYLMTMARNHIIRAFKRSIRVQYSVRELSQLNYQPQNNSRDALQEREYNRLLQQAIASLPPRQAQVYYLTREKGFSREEVAHELQIYPETVKTHMELALKKIRAYCLAHIVTLLVFFINYF
jgi:RNA polymerase sigma-70 factor (family 1)